MSSDHQPRREDAELRRFLAEVPVGRFGYTAAAARVATADAVLSEAWLAAPGEEPVDGDSRFDLASLTKPFVATLATRLDDLGVLPLTCPVGEVLDEAHPALARRTLDDLLRHRGGLRPWAPLYPPPRARRPAVTLDQVIREPRWAGARRGVYSDLGYLVYGAAVSRATGRDLAGWIGELGAPVAVQPGAAPGVVRSRLDTGREVELAAALGISLRALGPPPPGLAQDGNARSLGGLPGHAGLFGGLEAVTALGRRWLAAAGSSPGRDSRRRALEGTGPYARGWRRATRRGSAGPALSRVAFGHDGFTGGSLWIDPSCQLVMVLLGHRRDAWVDLRPLRRAFHRFATRQAAAGVDRGAGSALGPPGPSGGHC